MNIRTNMANRLVGATFRRPPALSIREKRRLANSKYPEGKQSPAVEEFSVKEEIIEEPVIQEEIPVRVENVEEEKTEDAAVANAIVEPDNTAVEPGTAEIRSKVLEELQQKPRKKYKVISLG